MTLAEARKAAPRGAGAQGEHPDLLLRRDLAEPRREPVGVHELEEAGADYTVETTEELKTLLMKLVTEAEN